MRMRENGGRVGAWRDYKTGGLSDVARVVARRLLQTVTTGFKTVIPTKEAVAKAALNFL